MTIQSDIQKLNVGFFWEGYVIDGSEFGAGILRVSKSINEFGTGVKWQGHTYLPWPVIGTGYERSTNGVYPRPKLAVANIAGAVSALCRSFEGMTNAVVTRKRTLTRYLDADNFVAGNPTANPDQHFEDEIHIIDRIVKRTKKEVVWELTAVFDREGVVIPDRFISPNHCTAIYRGGDQECGYHPHLDGNGDCDPAYFNKPGGLFDVNNNPVWHGGNDKCSKLFEGCRIRFGYAGIRFNGFPGSEVQ